MIVKKKFILSIVTTVLIVSGCAHQSSKQNEQTKESKTEMKYEIVQTQSVKMNQIYGIGFPGNDQSLYVAADGGLHMYKDNKWYETTTNHNDYIGFQAVDNGFIASGHPQKGTGLKDPLGLIQSTDKGKTISKLAFYGKKNFHFTAASFTGHDIYVIGEQTSNDLSLGVNYSEDNGETWKKSAFKGFNADSLGMIAVNGKVGAKMAMATRSGMFYSEDNGNTMKRITDPVMITALTFSSDSILFSSVENNQILLKMIQPTTGEQTNVKFPFLDYENPITYLAVNPKNVNQIAFSTYKNDVYESIDGGKNWSNLIKDGKIEQN